MRFEVAGDVLRGTGTRVVTIVKQAVVDVHHDLSQLLELLRENAVGHCNAACCHLHAFELCRQQCAEHAF